MQPVWNQKKIESLNRALNKENQPLKSCETHQLRMQNQNLIQRDQQARRIVDLAERNADLYLRFYNRRLALGQTNRSNELR